MKAAVVKGPGRLEVWDVPAPEVGPYGARCRLLFGATCVGTDSHLISGTFPWPVEYPTVLGHESVGLVESVGSRVRNFKVGDLVTRVGMPANEERGLASHWGGYAEIGIAIDHWAMRDDGLPSETLRPYRVNQIVPSDISPTTATMFITWRETLSYIRRLGIGSGERVVIIGSGANGLAFAAHARNLGASSIVIGSASRRELAERAGGATCIEYRQGELVDKVADVWPDGCTAIIDAVGKVGQVERVLPCLVENGTVGIYGLDDWNAYGLALRDARSSFRVHLGGHDESEVHEEVVALVREGALDPSIWLDVDSTTPLAAIATAFGDVAARRKVKALIRLS